MLHSTWTGSSYLLSSYLPSFLPVSVFLPVSFHSFHPSFRLLCCVSFFPALYSFLLTYRYLFFLTTCLHAFPLSLSIFLSFLISQICVRHVLPPSFIHVFFSSLPPLQYSDLSTPFSLYCHPFYLYSPIHLASSSHFHHPLPSSIFSLFLSRFHIQIRLFLRWIKITWKMPIVVGRYRWRDREEDTLGGTGTQIK